MTRRKRDRAEQFLDMAGTMIVALDRKGEVILINKKGCQILGFRREEILGLNWFDNFVPAECRERVREAFAQLLRKDARDVQYFENHVLTKWGEHRLIAWYNSVLVDEDGSVVGPLSSGEDLTERRRAEAALRQSEAKYRDLFDNAGEAIFVHDLQGRFLDINEIACARLNYLKTELLAMSLESITPPDYVDELISELELIRATGYSRFETCHLARDGGRILVEITARGTLYDGQLAVISVARDISDRKKIEQALMESESRYRLLVEKSDQAIFVLERGVIRFVNDRFCQMLEASSSELVSTSFSDYVHPDERVQVEKLLIDPECSDGQTRSEPFKIVGRGGLVRWVEMHCSVIEWEGLQAVLAFLADVGHRMQAQDLLVRGARLRAVAELSGGVAHNFNNLLQIAQGYTEMAMLDLANGLTADAVASLHIVVEKLHYGALIVKALQDFTESYTSEQECVGTIFDLSEAVEKAVELSKPWLKNRPEAEGRQIRLETELQPCCFVQGVEGELLEVVVGLMKNAADALVNEGLIAITTRLDQRSVVLEVRDTGVGIPDEDLGKIFQPFWTTKGSLSVGMGLAQSLGIVKRHGGTLAVKSELTKGSVFTIRLPLARKSPEYGRTVPEAPPCQHARILLVDDEPLIVGLIEKFLAKTNFRIMKALSGREAIEAFSEEGADLVICDLIMPEINGWAVAKAIKDICERKQIPKTPFVLLTAWAGQEIHSGDLKESGIDEVVAKPIDFRKLQPLVEKFLSRAASNPTMTCLTD